MKPKNIKMDPNRPTSLNRQPITAMRLVLLPQANNLGLILKLLTDSAYSVVDHTLLLSCEIKYFP